MSTSDVSREPAATVSAADAGVSPRVWVFGLPVYNVDTSQAIDYIESAIAKRDPAQSLFIVNAHTLNLACDDPIYDEILHSATRIFADGTGLRWAARQRGQTLKDNLVGTDLMPALFERTAGRGYRYFLLGADEASIARAAEFCRSRFPGWEQAGFHHGYVSDPALNDCAISKINAARPDVLLVGMGNPLQERWIASNLSRLNVPLSVGVGGLFDHWGGNLKRAPLWVRRLGCEWVQLLLQDFRKTRRYLLGNPLFIYRMWKYRKSDRALLNDTEQAA